MKIETAGEPTSMATSMFLNEWREVDNGHYELILDDEAAPKAKVVLPAVTNGIINLLTVKQLQDKLENTEMELKRMKETTVQDSKALQLKMQASADEALQMRLDELRSNRRLELVQIKNDLRREKSRDISDAQVLDLLQHPVVMTKVEERVRDSAAEEKVKLEASFKNRVQEAKLQLSSEEIQEIFESNWSARAIYKERVAKEVQEAKMHFSKTEMQELLANNETAREIFKHNLKKHLDIEKTKLNTQMQEKIETAKKQLDTEKTWMEARMQEKIEKAKDQLSVTEIQELLTNNGTAREIFKNNLRKQLDIEKVKWDAQMQEKVEMAKKQLSDTEIQELFKSYPAAKAMFEESLSKRLEEEKAKSDATPAASCDGGLQSAKEATNTGEGDAVIGAAIGKEESSFAGHAALAFGTPIKQEFSFGGGVSRLTTPFRYALAPLASPKPTSPVVFGASSQPRSPLEVLSGAFSRPNIQQQSPLNPRMQTENKPKVESTIEAKPKRLRETDDVGGIEGGLKKIRKDESMQ